MSNTTPSLVSPTSTTCNHEGCVARIVSGRGYCSAHGGDIRLRRELGLLAAQERRFERERRAAERAKRPQFTERGDRRGVVAPGQGLSRFKKKPLPPAPPAQ